MTRSPVELVRQQDVVRLAQDLVRIPSQYIEDGLVQHREIADFLAEHMRGIGLDVEVAEEIENYPVVVGTTPGGAGGPTVGVIGHYSTVAIGDLDEWTYDPVGGQIENGRIYGRGSCDQKGGIAAVLVAVKALIDSGLPRKGRIRLLMVPGEGCTEMAMEPVAQRKPETVRCDTYLDSDGGPGRITLVHGGWIWLELTTSGKGGHSGALTSDRTPPINPVQKMVSVLARLQNPNWMKGERHPLFGPRYGRYSEDPIVDVNLFNAGHKVNTIPNEAKAQIDIRMLPSQTVEGVITELDRTLDELRAADPQLNLSYRILAKSKNRREISPDDPMIQSIQATFREMGMPAAELVGSIGGGRAALAAMGPVMHFGAGGGRTAHAPNEYAEISDLVLGARLHASLYARVVTG